MKILPVAVLLITSATISQGVQAALPSSDTLIWKAITFGQSTDVNFNTNVLPEKIGMNQVTYADNTLVPQQGGLLKTPVHIESRGGKIANSHDGLTFYYTKLPASANFILEAEMTVEQFGPENGAKPAAQEGAGLLVRDTLGQPRQSKLSPGFEEFPAASNMVMNAVITQDRKSHERVQIMQLSRNGVMAPWGNMGVEMQRNGYVSNIDLSQTPTFKLRITRDNQGFTAGYAPKNSNNWVNQKTDDAGRVTQLEPEYYYVGFFASRNARITINNAKISLTEANPQPVTSHISISPDDYVEIASSELSATKQYQFQLRSSTNGILKLMDSDNHEFAELEVKAGQMQGANISLEQPQQIIRYQLIAENGHILSGEQSITYRQFSDPYNLYASPQGKSANDGSQKYPLDIQTAAAALAPGGTLWLADGEYELTTLTTNTSGTPLAMKKLRPINNNVVFHGLNLNANYWDIKNITITSKSFMITGSHNLIDRVVAHHADDTGIWVTSPEKTARSLWVSHNIISNSESYNNEDPGRINADGFAVKMRIGEGNKLINCFAHGNADDGFDLFNKIEDGPNHSITIENSIALRNANNGFKMGGEGLPVAHRISNSIAVENGMDGFTDNFNPGALTVTNNTSLNNKRYNFLFRPGPYTTADKQGSFSQNISLRTFSGSYSDVVTGVIDDSNSFISNDTSMPEHISATVSHYHSLTFPETVSRDEQGNFQLGEFLLRK